MISDGRKYTNRMLEEDIDVSILNYIDKYIDVNDNELSIAIIIYIKLSELFWYDPLFIVDNDYELVKNLSDITTTNTNVICLHWAIIYSKLLDKYGIKNQLLGDDSHLKVKLWVNEFIIFADATSYGNEFREYLLSDLTNAKLGFKISGFKTLSSEVNKELYTYIEEVYKKLGLPCYSSYKVDELVEKFRFLSYKRLRKRKDEGIVVIDKKEIDKRIRFINKFCFLSSELHEVERLQFFSKYYQSIFEGFTCENLRCLTLCENNSDRYGLLKLIVVSDDYSNVYYYLENDNGFVEYEKDSLIELMIGKNICFKYDRMCILGFEDNEVKKLIKT